MSGKQAKLKRKQEKKATEMSVREVIAGIIQTTRNFEAGKVDADTFNQAMNGAEIYLLSREVEVAITKMTDVVDALQKRHDNDIDLHRRAATKEVISILTAEILKASKIN